MIKTKKQILELLSRDQKTRRTCGNGLLVVRDPRSKKGGLYFAGTMQRRVPGKSTPVQKECWIGVFGSNPGQYSLQAAHQKWSEIKQWSLDQDKDPGEFWKQQQQQSQSQQTLREAVDAFLLNKENDLAPTTFREYRLKLNNQVMGVINPDTPLSLLEWDNGGRAVVMDAIQTIRDGSKDDMASRCQRLLIQVFNYAIGTGEMKRGQNPAVKLVGDGSPTGSPRHHKSIDWKEVPELLNRVSLNRSNSHANAVAATKLLLLTFLRAGALTRLEWDWIAEGKITIPGNTPGLKRRRGKSDDLEHVVPITPEIQQVLDQMEQLHGRGRYVFPKMRQSKFEHLDPSAPNDFLKRNGYGEKLVAHGWRRVARTYGVDVLKAREVVSERQMGHLPKGKLGKAYDGAKYLDERLEFLRNWGQVLVQQGLSI